MSDPLRGLAQRGYSYALSLVHDPALAEDLLQDAWTGVIRAGGPRTRAYLFRAIRHRWIDAHRRRQVVAFEPLDVPVVDPGPDPRLTDREALERALATLRSEEREALFLCVVEGYTAAEVAQRLGTPRNTVLSLVHRGRQKLRAWYAAQSDEEVLP